jgi:CRISPR/Cas system-associated protein Csx1
MASIDERLEEIEAKTTLAERISDVESSRAKATEASGELRRLLRAEKSNLTPDQATRAWLARMHLESVHKENEAKSPIVVTTLTSVEDRVCEIEHVIDLAERETDDDLINEHAHSCYRKMAALHQDERSNYTSDQRERLHRVSRRLMGVFGVEAP